MKYIDLYIDICIHISFYDVVCLCIGTYIIACVVESSFYRNIYYFLSCE